MRRCECIFLRGEAAIAFPQSPTSARDLRETLEPLDQGTHVGSQSLAGRPLWAKNWPGGPRPFLLGLSFREEDALWVPGSGLLIHEGVAFNSHARDLPTFRHGPSAAAGPRRVSVPGRQCQVPLSQHSCLRVHASPSWASWEGKGVSDADLPGRCSV